MAYGGNSPSMLPHRSWSTDPVADPFGEQRPLQFRQTLQLLGASIRFESDSRELMQLVQHAYASLPAHEFGNPPAALRIRLELLAPTSATTANPFDEPQALTLFNHAGLLVGASAEGSVTIAPSQSAAIVAIDPRLLSHPYHARYEFIEFAVYTLATRTQGLIPLHAAGVGIDGHGILLMGDSGAGKSTLALHALTAGMDFLSEDSVFVDPDSLRATGIANFLHLQKDAQQWLNGSAHSKALQEAPVIRRRSGVEKFELDLRRPPFALAGSPLRTQAIVFLSGVPAADSRLAHRLSTAEASRRLTATQTYGSTQHGWQRFVRNAAGLEAYELRRGPHPRSGVAVLESLLRV
jgi:hypothetical protein